MECTRGVSSDASVVLEVRDLRVSIFARHGVGRPVDGVNLKLRRGRTLGLVGESGSGKSLTVLALLGLQPTPAIRITGGEALYAGVDLLNLSATQLARYRGKHLAFIAQDATAALDPLFDVGEQVAEPLQHHARISGGLLSTRVLQLLRLLRIPNPEHRIHSYPHQLSGGMRQRVSSAIALSCQPTVLLADEPTTALDPTVQATYLRLLRDIQSRTGMAILFISHDLGVVARVCDDVSVMYAGRIVETGPARMLFAEPAHPYTQALLNSLPTISQGRTRPEPISGSPPSIFSQTQGCAFAERCPYVMGRCRTQIPPVVHTGPGHTASCWRHASERRI
jgi:oligopeptide/dipeptide ABC transporter ATP-binding protein